MWIKDFLKEKLKEKIVNQKTCKDYTTWGIKVIWFFIQINGWFVLPIIFTNKWDYMHDQIQCTNKKIYYLEMFVAKSSIQKVEMMHISQLYVLSINIDGITRTIRERTENIIQILKVRQSRNVFFKPTILPKNEWKNSGFFCLKVLTSVLFVFWKNSRRIAKSPFEIN